MLAGVNIKKMIGADARGALSWGIRGFFATGGPAGAVAGALAGGAGSSCVNIIIQEAL